MKRDVFAAYAMSGNADRRRIPGARRRCEVDHLISREFGGADDARHPWPQPFCGNPWNAALKDRVEKRLHRQVCAKRSKL
jgi:hypothetical protein